MSEGFDPFVVSFTVAGQLLGFRNRHTIADLVRVLGMTPKPMPGRGKGLDRADIRRIARALGITVDFSRLSHPASAAG